MTPEPIVEEKEEDDDVKVESVTGVIEDTGIVRKKDDEVLSTILKIDPADLEAVQALLKSRSGSQVVLQ